MTAKGPEKPSLEPLPLPEAPPTSVDSWWRTQSATMALLKHAYGMIENAEKRLADQEKRLRQLEDLAATDPLTGLMNRRGFENFFEHELARIRRGNSPGSVLVLVDLDYFKAINDSHSHLAGDACLKLVADHLLKSIRLVDGAARFGGDEFALLLAQTDMEKSQTRVQRIKQALNGMKLDWQGKKLHFGASIGVAAITKECSFATAFRAADAALYDDKKNRRKRD